MTSPAPDQGPVVKGGLKVDKSLLQRAVEDDHGAQRIIFSQFIPPTETIIQTDFLGYMGLPGFGRRSFVCLTEKRLASLTVGYFGEVVYRDGYLEHSNSGVVAQPTKLPLYLMMFIALILSLFVCFWAQRFYFWLDRRAALAGEEYYRDGDTVYTRSGPDLMDYVLTGGALLICPFLVMLFWLAAVQLYYRFSKCGLILWIREGICVYAFANRNRILRANGIYRAVSEIRENRLQAAPRL